MFKEYIENTQNSACGSHFISLAAVTKIVRSWSAPQVGSKKGGVQLHHCYSGTQALGIEISRMSLAFPDKLQ